LGLVLETVVQRAGPMGSKTDSKSLRCLVVEDWSVREGLQGRLS
jgi:hypothetical protein